MSNMTNPRTLDERLQALEAIASPSIPGTMLTRVLREGGGFQWCLALGRMSMPKAFFYGATVEEAVCAAEKVAAEAALP